MSLRHLYKDLNTLGIYGDLIEYEDRTGNDNKTVFHSYSFLIISTNKYYGDEMHVFDIHPGCIEYGVSTRRKYIYHVSVDYNIITCTACYHNYKIVSCIEEMTINGISVPDVRPYGNEELRELGKKILLMRRNIHSLEDLVKIIKNMI